MSIVNYYAYFNSYYYRPRFTRLVKSSNTTKQVCAFQRFLVSFSSNSGVLKILLIATETVINFQHRFECYRCVYFICMW